MLGRSGMGYFYALVWGGGGCGQRRKTLRGLRHLFLPVSCVFYFGFWCFYNTQGEFVNRFLTADLCFKICIFLATLFLQVEVFNGI